MPLPSNPTADLDSPWKEALEKFLDPFLEFFFPHVHEAIDWSRGYVSLDKELHQIVRTARSRKHLADKLFRIWRTTGHEAWLLIHVEIQGQVDRDFPRRMFVYYYRIFDRYNRPVVSLALLADDVPKWRPDRFEAEHLGCKVGLYFLTAKLLDYATRLEELEGNSNPFATVVLAHLKAQGTRQDPEARKYWKVRLVKGLYQRGWSAEYIRQLFRLLDWILALPEELQERFAQEIYRYEEEKRMPYLTSLERLGLEKGLKQGRELGQEAGIEMGRQEGRQLGREEGREEGRIETLLELIGEALEREFGKAGKKLLPSFRRWQDSVRLRRALKTIQKSQSLEEVRRLLR